MADPLATLDAIVGAIGTALGIADIADSMLPLTSLPVFAVLALLLGPDSAWLGPRTPLMPV